MTTTPKLIPCPGFYSPQAGCHLRCHNQPASHSRICQECTVGLKWEVDRERRSDTLDQFGRAA